MASQESVKNRFRVDETDVSGYGLFVSRSFQPKQILCRAVPMFTSGIKEDVEHVRHNNRFVWSIVDNIVNVAGLAPRNAVNLMKEEKYMVPDVLLGHAWEAGDDRALAKIAKGPIDCPRKTKWKKKDLRNLFDFVATYNLVVSTTTETFTLTDGSSHEMIVPYKRGFLWAYDHLNHSCEPNAFIVPPHNPETENEPTLLVAARAIASGDEVTIDYLSCGPPKEETVSHSDRVVKRARLFARFGFKCDCASCTEWIGTLASKQEKEQERQERGKSQDEKETQDG